MAPPQRLHTRWDAAREPRWDAARELFRDLCQRSEQGRRLLMGIDTYFRPDGVRYYFTSAVGFFHGNSNGPDSSDLENVVLDRDGTARIRGNLHPINVMEPIQWLGRQIAAAAARRAD